jgi:hypothetical protein
VSARWYGTLFGKKGCIGAIHPASRPRVVDEKSDRTTTEARNDERTGGGEIAFIVRWGNFAYGGIVTACLVAIAISSLSVYPHELSYFNEISGGPSNGYKHLLGSNVDWGQDLLLIRTWMRARGLSPSEVRLVSEYPWPGQQFVATGTENSPDCSWTVMSVNELFGPHKVFNGADLMESDRIGYTAWAIPDVASAP